jgi:hypothetical protein
MVEQLDLEASRLGVTRQSIIKVWLAVPVQRAGQPTANFIPGEALTAA